MRAQHINRARSAPRGAQVSECLVEALEGHYKRHLALRPGIALVLALWSLATYLFEVFDAFPYLAVTSPTKRCGKTRLAELAELVCYKPLRTVGISVAALFRSIEEEKPTLLIDEGEFLRGRDERSTALREILNAGNRKGAFVIRCEGAHNERRKFQTYSPKMLILIGGLPDTVADRCIPIRMYRRTTEPLERFRFRAAQAEANQLREAVVRWAQAHRGEVDSYYAGHDLEFLTDREAELWLPLFAVCAVAAPNRRAELEAVARELADSKAADEPTDLGIRLLADARNVFEQRQTDRLASAMLADDLNALPESPWPGWSCGSGMDQRALSRLLKPFDIQPQNVRFNSGTVAKGYTRDSFSDAWARYLPSTALSSRYSATEGINTRGNEVSASAT